MSKLREFLRSRETPKTTNEYLRVLDDWDIPLNSSLTVQEANIWLQAHLIYNEEIVQNCVIEGMSGDEWDEAVEFVWGCLRRAVVPHEFVNLLIERQARYNELLG
jgi:hypothetical protein